MIDTGTGGFCELSKFQTFSHFGLLCPEGSVSNPKNGRWVIVRINDRGPYHKKRIIDLSERAARHLGIFGGGHSRVLIQEVPDSAQLWINQSQH